jgi:hypothetical protein
MLFPKRRSIGYAATHYAFGARIGARKRHYKIGGFFRNTARLQFCFQPADRRNIGGEAADALRRNCGRGGDQKAEVPRAHHTRAHDRVPCARQGNGAANRVCELHLMDYLLNN